MWAIATLLCAALALRAAVGVWPHSGQGKPPMHGDFEAQRHWMEITVGTPLREWYVHTRDNDLLYWGLDYPPLTAYVSWAFGRLAAVAGLADLVRLTASRGHESAAGKLFMRASVLACDLLVFLPAVAVLLYRQRASLSVPRALALASSLLLLPSLVVVDHGHFQYNNASLGLALLAFAGLYRPITLVSALSAAVAFSCALNFKQMELYHAPVVFVACAAAAWRGEVAPVRSGGSPACSGHWSRRSCGFIALAVVVVAVFGLLWAPFCLTTASASANNNDDSTWGAACLTGLTAVLSRLFPFDRSLFEDKVANLWCALEPVTGWRAAVYAAGGGVTAAAVRRRIISICTGTTAVLMTPALVLLARYLLADKSINSSRTLQQVQGSTPAVKSGHSRGRRGSNSTAAATVPAASTAPSPSPSPSAASCNAGDVTLLASFCVALAFFLGSYQVHEKSVLLAAIPAAGVVLHTPLLSLSFSVVCSWSLWPLLAKDGLLLPAAVLTGLHLLAVTAALKLDAGHLFEAHHPDIVVLQKAWRAVTQLVGGNNSSPSSSPSPHRVAVAVGSLLALLLSMLSVAAAVVPPPRTLPDIHPYLSAVAGAGCFTLYMMWGWGVLAELTRSHTGSQLCQSSHAKVL